MNELMSFCISLGYVALLMVFFVYLCAFWTIYDSYRKRDYREAVIAAGTTIGLTYVLAGWIATLDTPFALPFWVSVVTAILLLIGLEEKKRKWGLKAKKVPLFFYLLRHAFQILTLGI